MPPNLDTLDGRQLVLRNAISYFAVFLKDFRHPVSKRSAFQHEVLRYARDPHISEDFKRSIRSAADEIFSGKHRSEGNDDLDPDLPIHAAWSPAGPEDRAVFELCFLQVPHPDEPWYKSLQGTDWQRPLMLVGRALEMHLHTLSEQMTLAKSRPQWASPWDGRLSEALHDVLYGLRIYAPRDMARTCTRTLRKAAITHWALVRDKQVSTLRSFVDPAPAARMWPFARNQAYSSQALGKGKITASLVKVVKMVANNAVRQWTACWTVEGQLLHLQMNVKNQTTDESKVTALIHTLSSKPALNHQSVYTQTATSSLILRALFLQMPLRYPGMLAVIQRRIGEKFLREIVLDAALPLHSPSSALQEYLWEELVFDGDGHPKNSQETSYHLFAQNQASVHKQIDAVFQLFSIACAAELMSFIPRAGSTAGHAEAISRSATAPVNARKAGWRRSDLRKECRTMQNTELWLEKMIENSPTNAHMQAILNFVQVASAMWRMAYLHWNKIWMQSARYSQEMQARITRTTVTEASEPHSQDDGISDEIAKELEAYRKLQDQFLLQRFGPHNFGVDVPHHQPKGPKISGQPENLETLHHQPGLGALGRDKLLHNDSEMLKDHHLAQKRGAFLKTDGCWRYKGEDLPLGIIVDEHGVPVDRVHGVPYPSTGVLIKDGQWFSSEKNEPIPEHYFKEFHLAAQRGATLDLDGRWHHNKEKLPHNIIINEAGKWAHRVSGMPVPHGVKVLDNGQWCLPGLPKPLSEGYGAISDPYNSKAHNIVRHEPDAYANFKKQYC